VDLNDYTALFKNFKDTNYYQRETESPYKFTDTPVKPIRRIDLDQSVPESSKILALKNGEYIDASV